MKKTLLLFIGISTLLLAGCSKEPKIANGDLVTLAYTGTFENGQIFETQEKTITVGSGEVIKGIEDAIINKKLNQSIIKEISPKDGYGKDYSIYNQQRVSKLIFDKLGISTKVGNMVTLDKITGKISKQEKDKEGNDIIIIDINPAQTRQDLEYTIIIKKIQKAGTTYTL